MPTVQAMTTLVSRSGVGVDAGQLEYVVHDEGAEDEAGHEHQRQHGTRQDVQGKHPGPAGQHGHDDHRVGIDRDALYAENPACAVPRSALPAGRAPGSPENDRAFLGQAGLKVR